MNTSRRFTRAGCVMLAAWMLMTAPLALAADGPGTATPKEEELLAVLRSSAPAAEKAITCKLLAIYGSSQSADELATLLADEQLASWARIALEAIPGDVVDEALRNATNSLKGKLLIGAINSIGVRQDARSVDLLTAYLENHDDQVASAAAVALGRIGGDSAARSLRKALAAGSPEVRTAVAEGCVLCAERYWGKGNSGEATKIYDEVRRADVSKQRIVEATRGAILSRGQEGIGLLMEQFRSPDKVFFQLALGTLREFPGEQVDRAVADELVRAAPDRAALIIQAMADRPGTVVLPAVLAAAGQGPRQVRMAAIDALGQVGDVSCLLPLLEIGLEGDEDLSQAALAALADLPAEGVDARIVALLSDVNDPNYPLLIQLVGKRRIDAVPALLEALHGGDGRARTAALYALGETVSLERLPVLIAEAVDSRQSDDVTAARDALRAASIRMADREACAALLAAAVDRSPSTSTKSALLEILGAMGGTQALTTVGAAAKSRDSQLQDVGSRLLGEWMTADAAPVLLDLAQTAPEDRYRARALRGYIRIARQFDLPERERVEMCRRALDASHQTAEKELVLDVLERYPSRETLQLARQLEQSSELKEKAAVVARRIAQRLPER